MNFSTGADKGFTTVFFFTGLGMTSASVVGVTLLVLVGISFEVDGWGSCGLAAVPGSA